VASGESSERVCRQPRILVRSTDGAESLDNWPLDLESLRQPRIPVRFGAVGERHIAAESRGLRAGAIHASPLARTQRTETQMAKPNKIEIQSIPSRHVEGAWSRVVAHIGWCFHGTAVSILEERSALAVGHRLVADALERTPPTEQWSFATSVSDSYRDIVTITVTLELAFGDEPEMQRAKAFMAELTKTL
jgi:hypothetical protein